jgi:hypothetical protein
MIQSDLPLDSYRAKITHGFFNFNGSRVNDCAVQSGFGIEFKSNRSLKGMIGEDASSCSTDTWQKLGRTSKRNGKVKSVSLCVSEGEVDAKRRMRDLVNSCGSMRSAKDDQ